MSRPEDTNSEVEPEEAVGAVSRTRQKQEARAVLQLGVELVSLPHAELDALGLPEDLVDAIVLCRRLKLRAQSRQKRLIAQLLRAEDYDAIRQRMKAHRVPDADAGHRNPQDRLWLERLMAEGDAVLQDFMQAHPHADRQQLRTWIRSARQDPSGPKSERARNNLLSLIASVRKRHP